MVADQPNIPMRGRVACGPRTGTRSSTVPPLSLPSGSTGGSKGRGPKRIPEQVSLLQQQDIVTRRERELSIVPP